MKTTQIGKELKIGMGTHEGMSGKHNEDSLGVFAWKMKGDRKLILGVVADGVGGQIAGEIASSLAVETIKEYFDRQDEIGDINRHLDEAISAANKAVYFASQENPQYRGMSTTMAITAVMNNKLYTAHVGDSRIYLFRDAELRQISTDHTWAQEAIEAGLLTREQAKTHPNRNVIRRHLGGSPEVEVDHRLVMQENESPQDALTNQGIALKAGDTLLICSDGLTDMITDKSVHHTVYTHYLDLPAATNELIKKANAAGGKDNITVVLLQVTPVKALPPQGPTFDKPAAVAAAAAAASAPAVTTTGEMSRPAGTMTVAKAAPEDSGRGIAFFLAGGAFAVFLLIVIAGIGYIALSGGDETPTPTIESAPAVVPSDEPTGTIGAPATAAIITSEAIETILATAEPEFTPRDTPELIPTLRSTNTPTPTRVPPTATFTPSATPTATPRPPGGSGPRPTTPPQPTPIPTVPEEG